MLRCVRRDRCYSSCTSSSSQQNDKTYEAVKTEIMDASTMSSSPSSSSSSHWSDMFERNTPVLIKGQSATNRDGYLTCQRQYYIRISSFIRDGYYFKHFFSLFLSVTVCRVGLVRAWLASSSEEYPLVLPLAPTFGWHFFFTTIDLHFLPLLPAISIILSYSLIRVFSVFVH